MKKFVKCIPIIVIAITIINLFVAWLNSRELQKGIDDYNDRRMKAEKDFADIGMALESFERPISESEVPTRLV